jgi:hypothetical protein
VAAPTTSTLRNPSSPARVMPPSLILPAVEWSFGVKPIQAANWRPDRNSAGSPAKLFALLSVGERQLVGALREAERHGRCANALPVIGVHQIGKAPAQAMRRHYQCVGRHGHVEGRAVQLRSRPENTAPNCVQSRSDGWR